MIQLRFDLFCRLVHWETQRAHSSSVEPGFIHHWHVVHLVNPCLLQGCCSATEPDLTNQQIIQNHNFFLELKLQMSLMSSRSDKLTIQDYIYIIICQNYIICFNNLFIRSVCRVTVHPFVLYNVILESRNTRRTCTTLEWKEIRSKKEESRVEKRRTKGWQQGWWRLKRKNMKFILYSLSVMEVIKANFLLWGDKISQMKASLGGGGG